MTAHNGVDGVTNAIKQGKRCQLLKRCARVVCQQMISL